MLDGTGSAAGEGPAREGPAREGPAREGPAREAPAGPRGIACAAPTWDEAERLAALDRYAILDTPQEPDFDHVTRVAALVCGAPIAVVNFIAQGRQWFKAEVGLGVRETPLDTSICARAILQPGLTVIPETRADPRLAGNDLVLAEPGLRFYAGAPVTTPEGLPLGTVCVLDTAPRPGGLSPAQGEVLLALARQAMALMELRRSLRASELLAAEMDHRVGNAFALAGGLAAAAARADPAAAPFARDFAARLGALGRAQALAAGRGGTGRGTEGGAAGRTTAHALARAVLEPHRPGEDGGEDGGGGGVTLEGADAPVGPVAARALALLLHELATNAVKHGALSTAGGAVALRGAIEGGRLVLEWRERGGPPVAGAPARRGFGTGMAERAAAAGFGGALERDWAPDGLTARLTAPLDALAR